MYYKLTRKGYRVLLRDDAAEPPGKYSFGRVSRNQHLHTLALEDFINKTFEAAARHGLAIRDCWADGTVELSGDGPSLFPDFVFTLVAPTSQQFHFCVEFDRHTQTINSAINRDAIEWKIRRYESYHYLVERGGENFRVLFPTIGTQQHVQNITEAAAQIVLEPKREIFYAAKVADFEKAANPFTQTLWLSQRGHASALIPKYHPKARRPVSQRQRPLAWWFALA